MPGICGIASSSGAKDLAGMLQLMAARMTQKPWHVREWHVDDKIPVGIASVSLDTSRPRVKIAWSGDESVLAAVHGEIYDFFEQRQLLTARGSLFNCHSHAQLLANGYQIAGREFFRNLHGLFSAVLWDANRCRLILITDRFGIKPLYYVHLPEKLLFASQIKALLTDTSVSRKANLQGVSQFFFFGQPWGDDTFLQSVRALPGGAYFTYDIRADRFFQEYYYRLTAAPGDEFAAEGVALERIDAAFQRAMDRQVQNEDRLGLSLSGGLDSRTLLAAMPGSRSLTSVTVGVKGCLDFRCSQELARVSGSNHYQCLVDSNLLSNPAQHLEEMARLTDGHFLSELVVMPSLPLYRDVGVEVLFRGHAGELMHMQKAYNFSLNRKTLAMAAGRTLEDWLFGVLAFLGPSTKQNRILREPLHSEAEAMARDSLLLSLAETEAMHSSLHRVWHLFIAQYLRRSTALSLMKFGAYVETRLPYLDNDFVEALLASPPQLKLTEKIVIHLLQRRQPAFLKVMNVNTGCSVGAMDLTKLAGRIRLKVYSKLGSMNYHHLDTWLRAELRAVMEELLLSERCFDRGIFEPAGIKTAIKEHLTGEADHSQLLLAMLCFECGQRQLVDGDADEGIPCAAIPRTRSASSH